MQIRALLERGAPIYVVCPGKVFRTDELDATHTPVFHQVEGLAVDKGLTMAHLKGTLDHFARAMFGAGVAHPPAPVVLPLHRAQRRDGRALLRLRRQGPRLPHLQGHRLDRVGRLRHGPPERAARLPASTPTVYSGFAFGMGIERTLMFRNGVEDMRDMVEGDVRFSLHFGMEV